MPRGETSASRPTAINSKLPEPRTAALPYPRRPVATFSVVAWDASLPAWCIAVVSKFPAVGAVVPLTPATRDALPRFTGNENFRDRTDFEAGWIDRPACEFPLHRFTP